MPNQSHEAYSYSTWTELVSKIFELEKSGISPDTIIIITPPPKQ